MRRVPKLSFAQGQLMLWILAGCLVAFGSMFVFVRVSGVNLASTPRAVPRINVMFTARQDPLSPTDARYVIADVFDPSLMSLPSTHGFSSGAWTRKIEALQRSLGWNQQPAFLGASAPETPQSLLEPVPVDAAVFAAAEKTPALSQEPDDNTVPKLPLPVNQSVFRVLGALEDRIVVHAPLLPTIDSNMGQRGSGPKTWTGYSQDSVQVRIGVGADGVVVYALLDHSCGDDTVDAQALALAHQFRFEAEHDTSATSLTWGVLRFLWATQPPASTNAEATATQP
jgi:hypothetical protein